MLLRGTSRSRPWRASARPYRRAAVDGSLLHLLVRAAPSPPPSFFSSPMRRDRGVKVVLVQAQLHRLDDQGARIAAWRQLEAHSLCARRARPRQRRFPRRESLAEHTRPRAPRSPCALRLLDLVLARGRSDGNRSSPQLVCDDGLLDRKQDLLRHRQAELEFDGEGKHTALVALVQLIWQAHFVPGRRPWPSHVIIEAPQKRG